MRVVLISRLTVSPGFQYLRDDDRIRCLFRPACSMHGNAAFSIYCPLTRNMHGTPQTKSTFRQPKKFIAPVCRAHRRSRQRRKRGALPPVVPLTPLARRRAIDLLGNYTQRRPSANIISELAALLGRSPADRLIAGQWKDGLQYILRSETHQKRPKRSDKTAHVSSAVTHIPVRQRDVGRAFSILEVTRRILAQGRVLSDPLRGELTRHIGTFPTTEREALVVRKELSRRVAQRKKEEVLPPYSSKDVEMDEQKLRYVSMHLGHLANWRRLGGKRARKLEQLVGGILPRNRNVARSWKSAVDIQRRKALRKNKVQRNLEVADAKRRHRRRWKMAPEWTKTICRIGNRIGRRMLKAVGLWRKKKNNNNFSKNN